MSRKNFCDLSQRQKRRIILKKCSSLNPQSTEEVLASESIGTGVHNDDDVVNNVVSNESSIVNVEDKDLHTDLVNHISSTNRDLDGNKSFHFDFIPPIERANIFRNNMKTWIVKHHISQNAVKDLLEILNNNGHSLPKDCRTLMATPRNTSTRIIKISGGRYFHFGLAESMKLSIKSHYNSCPDELRININIDGLPIAKSSGSQFWPILGAIVADFYTRPFMIGIFHGMTKPDDADEFMEAFVHEARQVLISGLDINDKIITVRLNALICDAPAKAFICGIKYPTGYSSCTKCIQEGEFIDNTVVFPELDSVLRTDNSFRCRLQPEHHSEKYQTRPTAIETLELGLVSDVPLDSTHLIDEGVTKRMVQRFVRGKLNVRLKPLALKQAELRIRLLKSHVIKEFARRPRKLTDVDRWRATELRVFLLYTGMIILKDLLPRKLYNHFICLCVATRIISDKQYSHLIDYSNSLLRYFVNRYGQLYGKRYLSHHVHNLIHICDDVRRFGVIDSFSSYKFENYMYQIKQRLKIGSNPLEQVVNRIGEEMSIDQTSDIKRIHPIIHYRDDEQSIAFVEFDGFMLSAKDPNNCCILNDGTISLVDDIYLKSDILWLKVRQYISREPFFECPCNSTLVGIYLVSEHSLQSCQHIEATNVSRKCIKMKSNIDNSNHIVISLLH